MVTCSCPKKNLEIFGSKPEYLGSVCLQANPVPSQMSATNVPEAHGSSSSSTNMPPHPDLSTQADKPLGWWVHGHRVHNLTHFGITQENATRGRSRDRHARLPDTPAYFSKEEKEKKKNRHISHRTDEEVDGQPLGKKKQVW